MALWKGDVDVTGSAKVALGAFGVLVLVGLLFLLALLVAGRGDAVQLADSGVRVADDGSRFVTATFRNRTELSYSRVEVEVDFLGPDGSLLRTTTASVDGFGPETDWNLEILVAPSTASQALLRDMTCHRNGDPVDPEDCTTLQAVIDLDVSDGG